MTDLGIVFIQQYSFTAFNHQALFKQKKRNAVYLCTGCCIIVHSVSHTPRPYQRAYQRAAQPRVSPTLLLTSVQQQQKVNIYLWRVRQVSIKCKENGLLFQG